MCCCVEWVGGREREVCGREGEGSVCSRVQ